MENSYQQTVYYLELLETHPEKDILFHLHQLSLLGDQDILQVLYEQGVSLAERKTHDVNWKKMGLSLIGWAADQKHALAMLYLVNKELEESKIKYQQHDDYYKLIQQAEKIKIKLQKIKAATPEEQAEYDRLLEEVDLVIDDRKNYFKK